MEEYLVQMKGISKFFPGVVALDKVDFELRAGEVHALLGENGAGKSTLMKIIGGIYQKDEGEVKIRGKTQEYSTVAQASELGIAVIHQELNMLPPPDRWRRTSFSAGSSKRAAWSISKSRTPVRQSFSKS